MENYRENMWKPWGKYGKIQENHGKPWGKYWETMGEVRDLDGNILLENYV